MPQKVVKKLIWSNFHTKLTQKSSLMIPIVEMPQYDQLQA